tara:strand:+ start:4875 stop:5825 length:951 start_codon:yes stop_codon:yes gene_type:complete
MSGTQSESSLSQHDAVSLLLDTQAPEEASEEVQEPSAETEVEATEEETVEADAAEESQAEAEEVETEESDEEYEELVDTYRVKVDGDEYDVTQDELIKNYQLEQTAQKRLMKASEERKALDSEKAQTEQVRTQYEQALGLMQKQLQTSNQPKDQAYWDSLYEADPLEYVRQRDTERDNQAKMQAVQAEQLRLQQENLQREQAKLLEMIPEWKDSEVEAKEKSALVSYAKERGWTDQELASTVDSRYIELMRKAYLFDNLQSGKPIAKKKVKAAPKMVKSGQPKSKADSASDRKRKAFENLKKTNSRDAAVQYLLTR